MFKTFSLSYCFPVGMYSYQLAEFAEGSSYDLVAPGIQNVWICQVGSYDTDGTFDDFKNKLLASKANTSISQALATNLKSTNSF